MSKFTDLTELERRRLLSDLTDVLLEDDEIFDIILKVVTLVKTRRINICSLGEFYTQDAIPSPNNQ
jgi:hypothetical protein